MQNSPHNLQKAVRDYLARILPEAQLTDENVNPEYQPVLVMRWKQVMAAFAFANGDMRKSYDALYGSFKRFYASQDAQLDALDLAFVFCVEPGVAQLDQFCSQIETDVYFCRKFVVPLSSAVGTSLARLPFLPLAPVAGQSLRPPSAQTFLRQAGVPPVLARYIVVQKARSPEGIVEDAVTGKFGQPGRLAAVSTTPIVQSDRTHEPVQLETITIKNFRAYRKPLSFDLGTEVTVLYGPNGFGKTSFFDAVDFVITGGIGRIESRRKADFEQAACHLDAGDEEATVSLTFRHRGVLRRIVRSVRDRKNATLDGIDTERKAILAALTGGDIPATDRVENFVSLFRASHLFSQEQQELTKGFQDDCRLSAEIVSRMLAFDDYANAVSKATQVVDECRTIVDRAAEDIRNLAEQNTDDGKELSRLNQTASKTADLTALNVELTAFQEKLQALGFPPSPGTPDAAMVRGWRAALESRQAQSQTWKDRLTILAREVASLPKTRADLVVSQQQLMQREQLLKATDDKRIATEHAVRRFEEALAQLTAKRNAAQSRADLLNWVRSTQPILAHLVAQERGLKEELALARDAFAPKRALADKAAADQRARETATNQIAEKLAARRGKLAAVQALAAALPAWSGNRRRIVELTKTEGALAKAMEDLKAEERDLAPKFIELTNEEQRFCRLVAEVDRNHNELRALLSQLQGHVKSGLCPLCGVNHGTKDGLLHRIQEHVATDAATAARAELTTVREKLARVSASIEANKAKQKNVAAETAATKSERAKLDVAIAEFERSASETAVALEAAGATPQEQLQALAESLHREIAELEAHRLAEATAYELARSAVARAEVEAGLAQRLINDKNTALVRTQEEIARVRTDPRFTQISADIEGGQLTDIESLNSKHLESFRTEAATADDGLKKARPEVATYRQEIAGLRAQIATLHSQIAAFQKTVAQTTSQLESGQLPLDSTPESLQTLAVEESRIVASLLALRDQASGYELALDAATTSAALTTLQQTIRNRETAIAQAKTRQDLHKPWFAHFEEMARSLATQQNNAIASFTREYGPRTSVIQRRLRSVYGFDDIEIKSHDSTISVRIKRNGIELRPPDYFSQSQQQTLMLGLFLTACSSQTWSALSPIFLDDPVTHFDDLNTYAFLDLVVGLLDADSEKRQFVISTCDDKLLQLARQKFRHLGQRAKFYQFTAIGADGPSVTEITTE